MPATKTKTAQAPTGASAKGKAASSTNGTTTPISNADKKDTLDLLAAGGKPDKNAFDADQDRLKSEIDALQVQLSAVRDKIGLATKSSSGNDRRTTLRTELDSIRGQQSNNKASRGKILDQVKNIQDGIQKKIKDLQASKSKVTFRTVEEVDTHIRNLEKQVESGNMKLADEKRALQDISTSKRTRRAVEGFQAAQESIEADRRTIDDLRKELDDPEFKAFSDRYEAIKAELDELKKEGDEAYANRSKLFEERDDVQNKLNTLYNEKREAAQRFREANDRYWSKLNEDRARRAERARAQRAAEELQKKEEIAERLREEAEAPAFQAQIEDCQTLIDYFSGKSSGNNTTPLFARTDVAGVPKHELRKVEEVPEGLVAKKKKGEDDDAYFVGGKGKGKGKRGTPKGNGSPDASPVTAPASNIPLNVPLATLSALLTLSIPPPASATDVPRLIEDLKTKKAWFEANQARVTSENVAKAEANIQRIVNNAKEKVADTPAAEPTVEVPSTDNVAAVPTDSPVVSVAAEVEAPTVVADS